MPALRTETSQLLIYDPDKSRTTVHCSVSRPTPLEERTLGRLFLLIELDSQNGANHEIIGDLQRTVTSRYYQSEDFQVEAAFERALQAGNERLQTLLDTNLKDWIRQANILIAVLKNTNLHFTVVGRMHAFLVHRQRIVDILESSAGAPTEEVSPLKIFSNIISGQLNFDDSILFCTTSLLDYLSQEKLKRMIAEHTPAETTQALERLLSESEGAASFGALIVKLLAVHVADEAPAPQPPEREYGTIDQPQSSMEELIRREQKTNELLTHPLWPNVGRILKRSATYSQTALQGLLSRRPTATEHSAPSLPAVEHRTWAPKAQRSVGTKLLRGVWWMTRLFVRGLLLAVRGLVRLFRQPPLRRSLHRLPHGTNRRLARGASWFQKLSPQRKALLVAAVVLIVFFAQSVVTTGKKQERKERAQEAQILLASARTSVSAADAALLIKNEGGARRYLQEASAALNTIPADQKQLSKDIAGLRTTIQGKLAQIQHVVAVPVTPVYDTAQLDVGFTPASFALAGDALYTFHEQTSALYSIDLLEQKATLLAAPGQEQPFRFFVPGAANRLSLFQTDGNLQAVSLSDQKLTPIVLQYPAGETAVAAGVLYNSRLYVLDTKNSQIYRFQQNGDAFTGGQAWITEPSVDLSSARSLAIDGKVYVLLGNGSILKFSAGKREAVTFETVDPQLANPTKIITGVDLSSVYVLDGPNHRVVEFSKDGTFLQQFSNAALQDARDFTIRDGKAYVLSGTQLHQFSLTASAE